ncbi:MAG: cob(I)yrinic acid a,c-diamide adenosyltransferase [Deltaproteobacteria bacterium]|nr:cob(I)yrinic acid a,c-diamide adenosyltransferase [Deltaproteobacteria bacterium]
MSGIDKGYVHIYTGDGKGKTTAALGLALRAAGRGLRSHIVQFMKGQPYGELDAVKILYPLVVIEQYGDESFCRFTDPPDPGDIGRARVAFDRLIELMGSGTCDILIGDEAITAVTFKLISEDDLLAVMRKKPEGMELVLTGRGATEGLIHAADLVTEMKEIKHYYTKGILARKGIEL